MYEHDTIPGIFTWYHVSVGSAVARIRFVDISFAYRTTHSGVVFRVYDLENKRGTHNATRAVDVERSRRDLSDFVEIFP